MQPATRLFSRSVGRCARASLPSASVHHQIPSSRHLPRLATSLAHHRSASARCFSTTTSAFSQPPAPSGTPAEPEPERKAWRAAPHRRPDEPVYELYFTCNVCKHRQGHSVSKQGYHHGTVLVRCDGCQNRHLISDHLKIFYDKGVTLEDILKDKGQSMRTGSLDKQGDVEFWDKETADEAEKTAATQQQDA